MSDQLPPWVREAASAVYHRIDRIAAEAGYAGQCEQDPQAEMDEFVGQVGEIIWHAFRSGPDAPKPAPATCTSCGEPYAECRCDEWDAEADREEYRCACGYCFCADTVEMEGDACVSCRNGAHQG